MRTIFHLLLLGSIGLSAQNITFTDPALESRLAAITAATQNARNLSGDYVAVDMDADGHISIAEAAQISRLYLNHVMTEDVFFSNIGGLEHFVNLKTLTVNDNWLSGAIDLSAFPTLETFSARGNDLTAITFAGLGVLTSLNCAENQLQAIDITSEPHLEYVNLSANQLTALNLNGLSQLNSLDVTHQIF